MINDGKYQEPWWRCTQDLTEAWKHGRLLWVELLGKEGRVEQGLKGEAEYCPKHGAASRWVHSALGMDSMWERMEVWRSTTYAGRLSWLSLKESSQRNAEPEKDLAWQGLATSSSLFLRTKSLKMLHMKFPGSFCLGFQALLMNEVEGKLVKSVVLSPGCPLEEIIISIN